MLVKPPLERLLPKVENRYTLAILVAKRARQLVDGAMPLMRSDSPNLVTVACEELGSNRVACVRGQVAVHIPLRPEVEAARLAARNAAAQASLADAVKDELERAGSVLNEAEDESDAVLIAERILDNAAALDDEDVLVEDEIGEEAAEEETADAADQEDDD